MPIFNTFNHKLMKQFFISISAFLLCTIANAQLSIYSNLNQQGSSATCVARTIYLGANVPNGLNDGIKSITLKQGFMATLAANEDGTGEGFNYIASVSDLSVNLANVLQNKVSFIRVLPIINVKKKGAGTKDNVVATSLNAGWLYDWGGDDESTLTREYVPMAWGNGASIESFVDRLTAKTSITSFLAFNEPDNVGQSNIATATAVPAYKKLLRSGYRMGSPATKEEGFKTWLQEFTTLANQDTVRIDFVAVHWYDWGNWSTTPNTNPDANALFNRFKNYITAVYNLYGKPIWITEFNANPNRIPATHEAFMALALPWLESDPRVERYAYFFPTAVPATSAGLLTAAGRIYSDHVSTAAYPANVYDKRAGASVSVAESYDPSFLVYPSITAENKIDVVFKAVSDAAQIKVFNMTGQLVSTHDLEVGTTSKTIDIAHFTEGSYLLMLQDKGRVQSRKFIRQ
jgi:Glycosyl hydrolase catalytic core/Secretion system C-terminal sorting domain